MLAALQQAKLKKTVVEDKTRRPPAKVEGVHYWFNLPQALLDNENEKLLFAERAQNLLAQLWGQDHETSCLLVDFFAYSCTNCIRTIPVLKRLQEKYAELGLKVVAFHRPEFEFEKDPFNMKDFIERNGLTYPVGLDNDDVAWNNWKVAFWPQHFLVSKDESGKFMIEEEHAGDRNHHLLEQKIVQIIWRNLRRRQSQQPLQEQPTIHPYNHETWYDAEFFMGKLHRVKNGQSKKKNDEDHHKNGDDDGCSDGVCTIRRPPSASASSSTNTAADDDGGCSDGVCVIRRPAKKESGGCNEGACSIQRPASAAASAAAYKGLVPLPSSSASLSPTYTVYGTGWCPFCRRSKALLEALSLPFQYVDMDHYGGAAAVKDILSSTFTSSAEGEQQPLLPASHKTIPIVYCDENFIGGFSDLVSTLQQQADSKVTEELLQHVAEKAALHSFEFDKSGHKARVTLPLASTQWSTTDEYIIAKVDDAELELSFEMTIPPTKEGEQEKETLVSLYLVAEPPLSEEVMESRKELLERMKKKEGAEEKPPLALFVGDDKLVVDGQAAPEVKLQSTFQQQQVKLQRSDGQVVVGATIGWPDRHLVPELTSSSTSGSAKLLFPKGCKLYVLYFTTEPPRA